MGVISTQKWLEEHFDDPIEICTKVLGWKNSSRLIDKDSESQKQFRDEAFLHPRHFYSYLQKFGMYRPTKLSNASLKELKQKQVWSIVEKLFVHYQQLWHGPDVPLFIFPFNEQQRLFNRPTQKNKSGLSFPDKLFLFLTPNLPKKEIEALFVHEYHHVCRMNQIDKSIEDYTLLDSIMIEGLAEAVVEAECGVDYVAPWCKRYTDEQLRDFWKKYIANHLQVKKNHPLHDRILFGEHGLPNMLGYASGFMLAKKYFDAKPLSIEDSFKLKAEEFLKKDFFN